MRLEGTIHLEWKDEKLREDFNVKVSRGKRWLGGGNPDADKPKAEPKPEPKPEPPKPSPSAVAVASKPRIVGWQNIGDGRQMALYE